MNTIPGNWQNVLYGFKTSHSGFFYHLDKQLDGVLKVSVAFVVLTPKTPFITSFAH